MYIATKDGVNLHWWGESLVLVYRLTDFYIFTPEETLLLQYFAKTCNTTDVIISMENDLGLDTDSITNFINIFLENFSEYFQLSTVSLVNRISISGQEGKYFPLELHISMTNSCSQHCIHCYKSATHDGVYIDYDSLRGFLNRMCGFTPYLTISGGEPTLHPQFSNLLEEFESKYNISVLTSGYNIDDRTLLLLKNANLGVTVSIYSSIPEKHDLFAATRGSFKSILSFIDAAAKEGIPVNVSTILTRDNYGDIKELIEILEHLGVQSISVGKIAPLGRASTSTSAGNEYLLNKSSFLEYISELNLEHPSVNIWADDVHQGYDGFLSSFRCTAGTFLWAIYENGEIHPCATCSRPELKMGNITNFDDSILVERSKYDNMVAQLPYMQLSADKSCPFIDEDETE